MFWLWQNQFDTVRLGLPIPMLCLPACSRRACILKGRHLVYAKLLPSGFPILIFLLLRIECMSFAFHSPNNPKRSSSLNPVVARVARRCWRKKLYPYLVGGFNPSEKYEFVSWITIPNIWKVIKFHGSSQYQPWIDPIAPLKTPQLRIQGLRFNIESPNPPFLGPIFGAQS